MPASFALRLTVSNLIILDTSIFIDHLRTGCYQEQIDSLIGLVRLSSVVMSELWRGVTKPAERAFLKNLEKNHQILTPTEKNWLDSGPLLSEIRNEMRFAAEKLRDLHFDVLIALTARSYGAMLISSNSNDFDLIRKHLKFDLIIWQAESVLANRRPPYGFNKD
jgi:predicted nucleic acid-binding protein